MYILNFKLFFSFRIRTQKRNIEDDRSDNYNYIPSLKRIKMKNFDEDTEQSLYVEENNMLTFVQNETPSILTNEVSIKLYFQTIKIFKY